MDHPVNGKISGKPRILVAPLDWGLGHATRCIPIIQELITQGAEPIIAAEGAQEFLLRSEFPQSRFVSLTGYRIKYAKTAPGLSWKMIMQAPKIRRAIQHEHQWLNQRMNELELNGVISDNRYGLYHKSIPSIIITHQLRIKSPWGKWTENILQKKNYNYISNFHSCWIPDYEQEPALAGELSHPEKFPQTNIQYIGPLSRFKNDTITKDGNEIVVILSGPEPQRSILENKIIKDISQYPGKATVIRGLPGHSTFIPSTNMIQFYNHIPANEMAALLANATYVISRGGYSTIMDLIPMRKKCIFIPTPGQTEQLYLCKHLQEINLAMSMSQQKFSLPSALENAKHFGFSFYRIQKADPATLQNAVHRFLASV